MKLEIQQLTDGKLPVGMKPFKLPFTAPEVEKPVFDKDETFTITFAAGMKYSDARQLLHFEAGRVQRVLDAALSKRQIAEVQNIYKFGDFLNACRSTLPTTESFEMFGLEIPDHLCDVTFDVEPFAKRPYVDILKSVKHELDPEADKKAKDKKAK